jgi:hypothetical protein
MRWIFAVLLLIASQDSAVARSLPDGGVTAQEVAGVLKAKGYQAEITTDQDGDPKINSISEGAKFGVWFYECAKGPRCHSIQFAAGFTQTDLAASRIEEWNRTKRFGRAYFSRQSNPWVEMDVDLEHGANTEALANDLDRWILVLSTFRKFINP